MNPVPDDPRYSYVLDPLWRAFKSIDWQNFGIYLLIGLSAIVALLLIFYLLGAWKDHS